MIPFGRTLKLGSRGSDVKAVKRALSEAGYGAWTPFTPLLGIYTVRLLKKFQHDHELPADGVYGPATHEALSSHFDAYGKTLYLDIHLDTARKLLAFCQTFSGPYLYGGGHGIRLTKLSPRQALDCSSSVCLALSKVGIYDSAFAVVSGALETFGDYGNGRYLTIHANAEHVWLEFTLPEGWSRFDTSPHGDGDPGPRVRHVKRSTAHFAHRHPRGF